MSTLLECRDLTYTYGKKTALEKVNLNLENGKIIGLFGPNGSGKTTLIKLITGMLCDDNKSIRICGDEVGDKTKAVISYSPDRVPFRKDKRVRDLIDMYELMYEDFDRKTAEEKIQELKIDNSNHVGKLSKGNAEKVLILLTMSRKAGLYILDEPFNGVDR